MKYFDASTTRQALPFTGLIAAIERMFVAGCEVPPRHVHKIANGEGEQGTVLIMPAWYGGYMGIKTVNIFPGNAARGLPGLFSTYTLYSAATGQPLAMIDGDEITARRTAAASALAARYLARSDARRLLVVGSGRVARLLPDAYRALLPIDESRSGAAIPRPRPAWPRNWRPTALRRAREHGAGRGRAPRPTSCRARRSPPNPSFAAPGSSPAATST